MTFRYLCFFTLLKMKRENIPLNVFLFYIVLKGQEHTHFWLRIVLFIYIAWFKIYGFFCTWLILNIRIFFLHVMYILILTWKYRKMFLFHKTCSHLYKHWPYMYGLLSSNKLVPMCSNIVPNQSNDFYYWLYYCVCVWWNNDK